MQSFGEEGAGLRGTKRGLGGKNRLFQMGNKEIGLFSVGFYSRRTSTATSPILEFGEQTGW